LTAFASIVISVVAIRDDRFTSTPAVRFAQKPGVAGPFDERVNSTRSGSSSGPIERRGSTLTGHSQRWASQIAAELPLLRTAAK
jgi:hypothetical protein